MEFITAYEKFYKELGESKKMVLSTSLNDEVTSRMMSIVVLNKKIYFSKSTEPLEKYNQIKANPKYRFAWIIYKSKGIVNRWEFLLII